MTYELAKELKEAGFPMTAKPRTREIELSLKLDRRFVEDPAHPLPPSPTKSGNSWQQDYEAYVQHAICFPTLSELIEACGDKFREVKKHLSKGGFWTASTARQAGGLCERGTNPEEAVARLWLALNKK